MNKKLAILVFSALVFGFSSTAYADSMTGTNYVGPNGKVIGGYMGSRSLVGMTIPDKTIPEHAVSVKLPTYGNTQVIDMKIRLLPEDQDVFLFMVERAHINY